MDTYEQSFLLECLKKVHKDIGLKDAATTAKALVAKDARISNNLALNWVNRKSVSRAQSEWLGEAARVILAHHGETVLRQHADYAKATQDYLKSILALPGTAHVAKPSVPDRSHDASNDYAGAIFNNWQARSSKGHEILRSGIYQLFRRYKPTRPAEGVEPDASAAPSASGGIVVIIELIFVDAERMECLMVTAGRAIYFGTMFIDHEQVLSALLHRKPSRRTGLHQRFISMKLEGRRRRMYSGLTLKTGDQTRRPVACECLYVDVPREGHPELYAEFEAIRQIRWTGGLVEKAGSGSVIAQYITDSPPTGPFDPDDPAWQRVRYISDFPVLAALAERNKAGVIYFREPLRTISGENLVGMPRRQSVFRQVSPDREKSGRS